MILFKEDNGEKLEQEWHWPSLDARLRFIVYAISAYMWEHFGLNLLITEIYRTSEMQDSYYKDNPDYQIKKWNSVHQYWRGIDFRTSDMTSSQMQELKTYVNSLVAYGKEGISTLIIHDIGLGSHGHLQCNSGNETILKR